MSGLLNACDSAVQEKLAALTALRDSFNARQHKWDLRFMEVAQLVSTWSKDRTTKVGCVVVSPDRDIKVTGYNGFPRGCDDNIEARHDRNGDKYKWAEHAERNSVFAAARMGESLSGCSIYSTLFPCADCARAIIQSGISLLVTFEPDLSNEKWGQDFSIAINMLHEAGVRVRYV